MDYAEDGRIGADSEAEGRDRDGREERLLLHRPNGISKIGTKHHPLDEAGAGKVCLHKDALPRMAEPP